MKAPVDTTGITLLGEIISYDIPSGTRVPYGQLLTALDAAGLDRSSAKALAPRNAFTRALLTLTERRIVRRVAESVGAVTFQFTREDLNSTAGRLDYAYEAVLSLDKVTGQVTCVETQDLADRAQAAVNAATDVRRTNDITRLVQRLFEGHADLFPVRVQGGCYFVPVTFRPFLNQIETFLTGVGGGLRRFPVPAGFPAADRSVGESVRDGLEKAIADHEYAVSQFDPTTRDSTLEKTVQRINETRFKVEAYAEFLSDKRADLDAALADARAKLRAKVAELNRVVPVPEPDAVAGGHPPTEPNPTVDEPVEEKPDGDDDGGDGREDSQTTVPSESQTVATLPVPVVDRVMCVRCHAVVSEWCDYGTSGTLCLECDADESMTLADVDPRKAELAAAFAGFDD